MKNWNTDVNKFKTKEDKKIWELIQTIEYGLDGEPLSKTEVIKYWDKIKGTIDPENKRLLEFYIWENNIHSQSTITFGRSSKKPNNY